MNAYVVCSARPGRAIEVLGTYVESGDAARACDKNGPGAHIVRSGALLRYHGRTARSVLVAIEKALRENTHPALTYKGTPIAPEPEPSPEADEQLAQPIEEPSAPEAPRAEPTPEQRRAAELAAQSAYIHGLGPKPEPTKPRQATKRGATKRTRSATKQPRKTARRAARDDSADGTLADLATILRQAERHGSIARLLADAALGRAVRRALGPVG